MRLGNDKVSFLQWFNWQRKARWSVSCSLCGGKIYNGEHLRLHRKVCKKPKEVKK